MDPKEAMLRPPEKALPPYPAKFVNLKNGEKMVIRQASREEVPALLKAVSPLIKVERDFYDIVGARTYAELLGWKLYRVRDEYCLVGLIDGVIVGQVNGRTMNDDIGVSYHTIAMRRGLRIGSLLFAAKMEYHLEHLGQKEVYIVAESPIGFQRWMTEYGLEERPDVQHELGGVMSWSLTKELYLKAKDRLVLGERPVPEELLETSKKITVPDADTLVMQITGKV
ncbi:MAG: hypothetical protein ABIJ00_12040 [Candidatus Eisenbacteria bacterium]